MRIRITQIDGKLPNLALMQLSSWHKARGDEVTFTREARRDMFEPDLASLQSHGRARHRAFPHGL